MAKAQKTTIKQGDDPNLASHGVVANRVHLVVAKTINLGNYESVRVEYGESRAVPDGKSFEQARVELVEVVLTEVMSLAATISEAMTS